MNAINETKLLLNYEVLKLYLNISLSYLAAVVLTKEECRGATLLFISLGLLIQPLLDTGF
jgi:hypothetical protein